MKNSLGTKSSSKKKKKKANRIAVNTQSEQSEGLIKECKQVNRSRVRSCFLNQKTLFVSIPNYFYFNQYKSSLKTPNNMK